MEQSLTEVFFTFEACDDNNERVVVSVFSVVVLMHFQQHLVVKRRKAVV